MHGCVDRLFSYFPFSKDQFRLPPLFHNFSSLGILFSREFSGPSERRNGSRQRNAGDCKISMCKKQAGLGLWVGSQYYTLLSRLCDAHACDLKRFQPMRGFTFWQRGLRVKQEREIVREKRSTRDQGGVKSRVTEPVVSWTYGGEKSFGKTDREFLHIDDRWFGSSVRRLIEEKWCSQILRD